MAALQKRYEETTMQLNTETDQVARLTEEIRRLESELAANSQAFD
jgi:chaperonin cofactor prefoldin